MNKTKIEWVRNPDGTQGYTSNPIKGWCPNNCPYCYAHRIYHRRKWDKTIRFDEKELMAPGKVKKPSRIFVGSMIDMYLPDIPTVWVDRILATSCQSPQHTYITLTKFPENLLYYLFPDSWWLGVTVEGNDQIDRLYRLPHKVGTIEFASFEPLLSPISWQHLPGVLHSLNWIIIGGLTPKPVHKKEWIDDIVKCADALHIPVFIKDNAHYPIKRQEFPKV